MAGDVTEEMVEVPKAALDSLIDLAFFAGHLLVSDRRGVDIGACLLDILRFDFMDRAETPHCPKCGTEHMEGPTASPWHLARCVPKAVDEGNS